MKSQLIALPMLLAAATLAPAQVSPLFNFAGYNGTNPDASLIQGLDGDLYGSTVFGGNYNCTGSGCGVLFRITPAGKLSILHNFHFDDGFGAIGPMVLATDGNFYGTTQQGGANALGTVFRLTPSGGLQTLYSFTGQADGDDPTQPLIEATDGNLYGVTATTIFRITTTGELTTLYTFSGLDGAVPNGLIQATDGNLYGTTAVGGTYGAGTVFRVSVSGELTTIHHLNPTVDGSSASGVLVQASNGNLYGVASVGGAFMVGTVFEITTGGTFSVIYAFSGNSASGVNPLAGLIQATDGVLYGTTVAGGANGLGSLYALTLGGSYTLIYSFNLSAADLIQQTRPCFKARTGTCTAQFPRSPI